MVTDNGSSEEPESADLGQVDPKQVGLMNVNGPLAPQGITAHESRELESRAVSLVDQLGDTAGSKQLEMIDGITGVGFHAQRTAGADLELLRARMGDTFTQGGAAERISRDLVDLRVALNKISPHDLSQAGLMRRCLRLVPLVGKSPPGVGVLERIAIRYEPVSKQVGVLETRLRDGRSMLARDNIELRKLYEQVEAHQLTVQKNAYLGELVMQQLDKLVASTDETLKRERVRDAMHDVSMRVQDLRTMEAVHNQFFVSIEITRQNNARLGQSVERTLTLGTNVVIVGLAIQSALARQKRVLEATKRTREFLGNLIVENAAAIKQHTADIGDVYNNPVIAIEKVTQAHNDLIEAMDLADRLKQEGIESARENLVKLRELSTDLEQRSRGLLEQAKSAPRSLEA